MENIFINNFSEYDQPDLYDVENDGWNEDTLFIEQWAKKQEGMVIDLACGTGRTAIPLAKQGISVIGVDLHEGMLNKAREKSEQQNLSIKWVNQDITELQLDVKSSLIYMVGNSFQHFLTNESQNLLFSSVSNHLLDNGLFIFNTRFPSKDELMQPETEEYWRSYTDHLNRHVEVSTIAKYNSILQIQDYITIRRFKEASGQIAETRSSISLRYTYPQEMDRLLDKHGFEVVNVYQDFNEAPLTTEAYGMVYVCRKVGQK
ncbi:methyltransferase domain-containing protein [Bacillus sp. 31A1R]|uniref:Methyltransferase domain-containing protein n=1 Tax=Robertmurraya mangrovi TaxID=3098077 RepID=A0ABU5J309_9BACI|nr:methyltransferase domain-containing protein [Bacillus sp. 31A1R]MDZ5473731.1 methyltransferase domain-containing protein [Bacillus sp. 31A1R]